MRGWESVAPAAPDAVRFVCARPGNSRPTCSRGSTCRCLPAACASAPLAAPSARPVPNLPPLLTPSEPTENPTRRPTCRLRRPHPRRSCTACTSRAAGAAASGWRPTWSHSSAPTATATSPSAWSGTCGENFGFWNEVPLVFCSFLRGLECEEPGQGGGGEQHGRPEQGGGREGRTAQQGQQ